MDKHKKHFELARRLSKKSNHYQYRLGCVIVRHKTVIGIGYNQLKSHPKSPHAWKMIHAEFHALLGAIPSELNGADVYVYREHKDGSLAMARPCPSCHKMLEACGVRTINFTTEKGYDSYSFY